MDSSESTQRDVKEDFEQSVLAELQDVKQHLAKLTDEVNLVKRSSTGSQMEQLKQTVAESNSVIKLLAADFNTTRTMMLSEFRNILHAIPRGDEDALQEQLVAADEALREAQQAHTESLSQVEALQKELSDAKGALQQAEMDVLESNNRQNELQRELQATGEELMKAQKDLHRLKGELIRIKAESASQVKALQKELFDTERMLKQAQTDLSEGKEIKNELQRALQATKGEVERLKGELEEAKSQSCPPSEIVQSKIQIQQALTGGIKQPKEGKIQTFSRRSRPVEEKLKRSKNAWKPNCLKRKDKEDMSEDEELLKRFRSILNKLTPQNFQKLMNQTMQLPINSEERLKGVVDLVFEKAIMEPGFSQAYANMCRVMQSVEVKKADGEPVQFRKLILIKCQRQFERDRSDKQVEKERQRIMAITNEKEKEEALAELEHQQVVVKKQILGNIQFIGELFKLQLLTEKIMHNCISLLLNPKDEDSLECMALLVTVVGQSLDHIKGKAVMNLYFHQIGIIIKLKKVSSRICFILQDLKALRENNWKPRRKEAKPVMIDQIREEMEQEEQRKEQKQLAALLALWQNSDEHVQLGPGGRPVLFVGWGPEPTAPSMLEVAYEKRSKASIDEYLIIKDFKGVTACIKELKSPNLQHVFIRAAIKSVLEKKAHMRESIGRLFHRLLDESTISLEQFKIGLKEVLGFADDIAIDIPLFWTYLGEIIGGMVAEGAQNFAFLKQSVQNVQGKSAKFMAEIMKAGVKFTNEQQMRNVWRASGFTWDMFLSQGSNVQEFLIDNNLTFTEQLVEREARIPAKEENMIGNFQKDLMLFLKENLDNNAAFDFIEESIPPEFRKTKEFIRALVSAVCYSSVKGEGTNSRGDHELLKSRTVLMQRYIDESPDLELQALYAVQHLNNSLENPPGLLRLYFDVLFDEDVISEETFYAWRDSQDPSEKNGKGIALKSVTSFYTWLEE